jgi:hypothetical protein
VALGNELVEMRRKFGKDDADVGEAECRIAHIYRKHGRHHDAEKSLLEVARIAAIVYSET